MTLPRPLPHRTAPHQEGQKTSTHRRESPVPTHQGHPPTDESHRYPPTEDIHPQTRVTTAVRGRSPGAERTRFKRVTRKRTNTAQVRGGDAEPFTSECIDYCGDSGVVVPHVGGYRVFVLPSKLALTWLALFVRLTWLATDDDARKGTRVCGWCWDDQV